MCGITGFITSPSSTMTPATVHKMLGALYHRGPDGEGVSFSKRVGLAMRRLAIIDVEGGDQPLYNENKKIEVVGNGEIYNYIELQRLLKRRGHHLRTGSDIETPAHLYEDEGEAFVKRLRGMFALALYDKQKKLVFLIRDRLGEKPLYYMKTSQGIVFSSELKSILKARRSKFKLDPQAVDEFFHFCYVPEPRTMFSQVQKLPAGHYARIDLKTMEMKIVQYWNPLDIPAQSGKIKPTEISDQFQEACRLTLRSDVPVGLALSGGIDSSAILCYSAPQYKDTLRAFSIGYEGQPITDERAVARRLCKEYKIEHVEDEIRDQDVVKDFPSVVYAIDDPIAELAAHSIHGVYKLARKHNTKVILGGIGGDELFWGYSWVSQAARASVTKSKFFAQSSILAEVARELEPYQQPGRFRPFLNQLNYLFQPKDQLIFNDVRPNFVNGELFSTKFYTKHFADQVQEGRYDFLQHSISVPETDLIRQIAFLLHSRWLFSHAIPINDRLSMANSVELRSPLLDYKLFETFYCSKQLLKGYKHPSKYWLKKALRGTVPNYILNRPKQGFTPPVKRWLFSLIHNYFYLLEDGYLIELGILDANRVRLLGKTWLLTAPFWFQVFEMIVLEVWCREYLGGEKPSEIKPKYL